MDEIRGLWRGKRVDNGEWVEGDLSRMSEQLYIAGKDHWKFAVDPSTLGECMGLRDKNGKLIFEGDIIRYEDPIDKGIYKVVWDKRFSRFALAAERCGITKIISDFWYYNSSLCLHIGNIHDNPELLKRDKNNG